MVRKTFSHTLDEAMSGGLAKACDLRENLFCWRENQLFHWKSNRMRNLHSYVSCMFCSLSFQYSSVCQSSPGCSKVSLILLCILSCFFGCGSECSNEIGGIHFVFAKEWKTALLYPLIKKSGLDEIKSNYQPISNLSFITWLVEKAAINQLVQHADYHDLTLHHQASYKRTIVVRHPCWDWQMMPYGLWSNSKPPSLW